MDMHVDASQIMSPAEVALVLKDGERRARRFVGPAQNLVIFRLATCAGLRAAEIAGLELRDLHVEADVAHIAVRKAIAKRHKPRKVPLEWDQANLASLRAWRAFRLGELPAGADREHAPVVCVRVATIGRLAGRNQRSLVALPARLGRRLSEKQIARKFKVALRPLPPARRAELHTHSGRHTFATLALRAGKPLEAVRDALGHASIATTSVYLHASLESFAEKGNVFTFDGVSDAPGSATATGS